MSQPETAPTRDLSDARISVVIPTYCSASVLGTAIRSVLDQTFGVLEIIVVDDGGPKDDPTEALCATFGDMVRYVRRPHDGASAARNHGARIARGEWLAFLDADDVWEAEKIETQIAALEQHADGDFCITASRCWSVAHRRYEVMTYRGSLDPREIQRQLLVRNVFTGLNSSILVTRQAFEAAGGFALGRAAEDRRLGLALLERHRGVIVDEPLVRQQPGPVSWRDPEIQRRAQQLLIEEHASLFQRLDPSGRLLRRSVARMHERAGMHYLENGDGRRAARDLLHSVALWPFQRNPWLVLVNASLGRLAVPRGQRRRGTAVGKA